MLTKNFASSQGIFAEHICASRWDAQPFRLWTEINIFVLFCLVSCVCLCVAQSNNFYSMVGDSRLVSHSACDNRAAEMWLPLTTCSSCTWNAINTTHFCRRDMAQAAQYVVVIETRSVGDCLTSTNNTRILARRSIAWDTQLLLPIIFLCFSNFVSLNYFGWRCSIVCVCSVDYMAGGGPSADSVINAVGEKDEIEKQKNCDIFMSSFHFNDFPWPHQIPNK